MVQFDVIPHHLSHHATHHITLFITSVHIISLIILHCIIHHITSHHLLFHRTHHITWLNASHHSLHHIALGPASDWVTHHIDHESLLFNIYTNWYLKKVWFSKLQVSNLHRGKPVKARCISRLHGQSAVNWMKGNLPSFWKEILWS